MEKTKFSGHQTFSLRFGWLEKGFKFIKDQNSFNDEDAVVKLGVGKNMVESIKYWLEQTGIIEDGEITEFGDMVFDFNCGWDPYLEDDSTLWLLHWKIVTNSNYFTSGKALFSLINTPEFTKQNLVEKIYRELDKNTVQYPSHSILLKDIDCYLKLYHRSNTSVKFNHDLLDDSPMQNLNLINHLNSSEIYNFQIGSKINLPPEIVGFAITDYLKNNNKKTMRIQEALYYKNSPGQVFMLDENSLIDIITILQNNPKWDDKFSYTESAGIALINCDIEDGYELLNYYYKKR